MSSVSLPSDSRSIEWDLVIDRSIGVVSIITDMDPVEPVRDDADAVASLFVEFFSGHVAANDDLDAPPAGKRQVR